MTLHENYLRSLLGSSIDEGVSVILEVSYQTQGDGV